MITIESKDQLLEYDNIKSQELIKENTILSDQKEQLENSQTILNSKVVLLKITDRYYRKGK